MKNSIEVINLSKSYKTKNAVNNINFKINENEIVGLLGPSGCENNNNRNDTRIIKTNKWPSLN